MCIRSFVNVLMTHLLANTIMYLLAGESLSVECFQQDGPDLSKWLVVNKTGIYELTGHSLLENVM